MRTGEFFEPYHSSLSGIYLNAINRCSAFQSKKDAAIVERIAARALAIFAALPLLICAALDFGRYTVLAPFELLFVGLPLKKITTSAASVTSSIVTLGQAIFSIGTLGCVPLPRVNQIGESLSRSSRQSDSEFICQLLGEKRFPVEEALFWTQLTERFPMETIASAYFDTPYFAQHICDNPLKAEEYATTLIGRGFSPNTSLGSEQRASPLEMSVSMGLLSLTEKLLKCDANLSIHPEELQKRDDRLLWRASQAANFDMIKLMLERGANPLTVIEKETAWSSAVKIGCLRSVELFIQHGVHVDSVDAEGYTALDFCLFGLSHSKKMPLTVFDRERPGLKLGTQHQPILNILLMNGASLDQHFLDDPDFKKCFQHRLRGGDLVLQNFEQEHLKNMQSLQNNHKLTNPYIRKILKIHSDAHLIDPWDPWTPLFSAKINIQALPKIQAHAAALRDKRVHEALDSPFPISDLIKIVNGY